MAALWKYIKQRTAIEFLFWEEEWGANIHKRLVNVYEKAAIDVSSLRRWFTRVNGNPKVKEKLVLVIGPALTGQLVLWTRIMPYSWLKNHCSKLQVSHGHAFSLVQNIGYSKLCTKWIPRVVTDSMNEKRVGAVQELLGLYSMDNIQKTMVLLWSGERSNSYMTKKADTKLLIYFLKWAYLSASIQRWNTTTQKNGEYVDD